MKKIIYLLISLVGLTNVSEATNQDTIPYLEVSAKLEQGNRTDLSGYSVELWSELELISVTGSESNQIFRYELKKNVQYTILILKGDSVVRKVFINTKTPLADTKKGQKLEVSLGFPDSADCETEKCFSGTINFDYDSDSYLYEEGQSDEGRLNNL